MRDNTDKTRPPVGALRYDTPTDLYAAIPQVAELTQKRPRPHEDALDFLVRLRSSTTPEEAVTFTAFAAVPRMAIWWGHKCLTAMPEHMDAQDAALLDQIAAWASEGATDARHRIMRHALWAPNRTPAILLALSVGWSGGSIAPNDPAPVPLHRAPRSINSAVLSCLARADLSRRSVYLARFIEMAESLIRM